ncbi:MAG: metallophosphoesterase family protein [Thermodesulfovibrionia bacterium]|nr:metallophosphoesterase family protein [Thermodesulfovibrionia bacterium]
MRIAFFADIHSNREALEACLHHSILQGVERNVFLGDLIGYGADPEWVLDTIMHHHENGAIVVLGNHDEAVYKKPDRDMHDDARYAVEWTQPRLNNSQIKFLSELPLRIEELDRLYVHANAWAPGQWDYITDTFDAGRSLAATLCRLTFCGHVHEPCLYHQIRKKSVNAFVPQPGIGIPLSTQRSWLIIPGSVGQPRDGNPAACYSIYDSSRGMLTYFRVPYDTAAAAKKIREAGLPEWLGARLELGV